MGLIISRFRRKKTTSEILERLETKIKSIEKDGATTEQKHKRVIGYMMAYSVGIYVLFALLYYFKYVGRTASWLQTFFYASPLLLLPVLVIFLRAGISWYFNWSLTKNRKKLTKMREEKKKIIEEVMNTETYKVAKEILDKYGSPDEGKALKPFVPTLNVPGNTPSTPQGKALKPFASTLNVPGNTPRTTRATPGQLRQRQLATTPGNRQNALVPSINNVTYNGPRLRADQLVRPLPDKNRTALDKVVDYILKDGPNNRMALICGECYTHNGMAMEEEFEFVSYVCAYCGKYNPSRKQRPAAPLLSPKALPSPIRPAIASGGGGGDDSSVASSASESDDEKKTSRSVKFTGSAGETDRPPSPVEGTPKSVQEKKED